MSKYDKNLQESKKPQRLQRFKHGKYFDFAKVFGSVPPQRLLSKLSHTVLIKRSWSGFKLSWVTAFKVNQVMLCIYAYIYICIAYIYICVCVCCI